LTKVPNLSYDRVVRALQRCGWVVVRQHGSHIRLQKHADEKTLKIIVPAHRPIKRSTLAHILKQANCPSTSFSPWSEPHCALRRRRLGKSVVHARARPRNARQLPRT
jgi:predicted RNA binding protein YcfA (HicA-like mRNA interferase family)